MKSYIQSNNIEIRSGIGDSLFIKAFLPTGKLSHDIFDAKNKRFFKERVCKGAFLNCIDKDRLKILLNHNYKKEIKIKDIDIHEKTEGLYVEANIIPSQELLKAIEDSNITGVSYGFLVGVDKFENIDGELIRTIISFEKIMEVSILYGECKPCYPLASVIVCDNKEDAYKEEAKILKKSIKQIKEELARLKIEEMKLEVNRLKGRY